MPQAPQLAASLCRSTQPPLQAVRPETQLGVQLPLAQRWPLGQAMPQVPQFCESLPVSAQ
jgi:hypothetical protein